MMVSGLNLVPLESVFKLTFLGFHLSFRLKPALWFDILFNKSIKIIQRDTVGIGNGIQGGHEVFIFGLFSIDYT
ncbi:MAG: hypothetical protein IPM92_14835 [Saprospiraceae bacterium]|nr:hypothetical protein [Saprospiraceae bacterium]